MWTEFDFFCSQDLLSSYPKPHYFNRLFEFKKQLLPLLDKFQIEDFLILDEGKFFLLRVELSDDDVELFRQEAQSLVDNSSDFNRLTVKKWFPQKNARDRILSVGKQIKKRWPMTMAGIPENGWRMDRYNSINDWCSIGSEDSDVKIDKFTKFMTKVVGRFTRAYLEELPERVDDRWQLSLFIHLLLHSVSEQRFEQETRDFPCI